MQFRRPTSQPPAIEWTVAAKLEYDSVVSRLGPLPRAQQPEDRRYRI
jgi:hypothetical protein